MLMLVTLAAEAKPPDPIHLPGPLPDLSAWQAKTSPFPSRSSCTCARVIAPMDDTPGLHHV